MNCSEVKTILGLDDHDARLDCEAVRSHLGKCQRCQDRWPEVGLLLGVTFVPPAAARAPRRRSRQALAAALVVLVVAAVALDRMRDSAAPPSTVPARGVPRSSGAPSAIAAKVSRETMTFDRGQRYESRITYELWTAPTPSCLQPGASGS